MLLITVQRGDAIYTRQFPEDQEKKVLKFLETLRDSQFSGPHKDELVKTNKEKIKRYKTFSVYGTNALCDEVDENKRPKEKLKVSIDHVPDLVNA